MPAENVCETSATERIEQDSLRTAFYIRPHGAHEGSDVSWQITLPRTQAFDEPGRTVSQPAIQLSRILELLAS